ncbi:TetR/AcrR family transcriptional regulator [Antrihabitans cavernicola]|uniref:TetR/AcrR family transcriptional regulator n=1 Tax=Antrihabitans cavernicola TaxID=2495913 RepID=A0A5A7S689_9NOCA|nr:TetR/AcrR family transcriptional regulator [Spelaeibacter cavernicola]KAA0021688.1 TetR/AcrR family transcriptional regulator [Spelaeibacter cavernicola]
MARDVRHEMAAGAARLLAQRGLAGTSFSTVLELTGAPRGSLYHHFPGGKDQMIHAAIELAGARAIGALEDMAGSSPVQVTERFLALWRTVLEMSKLSAGCAVLAVTVDTDSDDLLDATATIFRAWRQQLAALFEQGGIAGEPAGRFAALLIASTEGAVVFSRAERSMEPFELVATELGEQVRRLTR